MNHLTDREIQDSLSADPQSIKEPARAHLLTCELCRERLAWYRGLALRLKEPPAVQFSPAFAENVLRTIQTQNESRLFWFEQALTGGCIILGIILASVYIDWSFVKTWINQAAALVALIPSPIAGSGYSKLGVYLIFIAVLLCVFKIADRIWTRQRVSYHKPIY